MYPVILLLWITLITHLLLSEAPDINIISCVVAAILQVAIQRRCKNQAETNCSPEESEIDDNSAEETVTEVPAEKMSVQMYNRSGDTQSVAHKKAK